jgi:hypothetical protein
MRIDGTPLISSFLTLSRYFQSFKRVCFLFPRISKSVRARMLPRDNFYLKSAIFSQWSNYAHVKHIVQFKLLKKYQKQLRIRGLRNVLFLWHFQAQNSRTWTIKLRRLMSYFTQGGKVRAFRRWLHFAIEQRLLKSRAKVVIFRMTHAHLIGTFCAWKIAASSRKAFQQKAKKVLGKWMFGGLSRSFERWSQITGEAKRLKAKAKTVIYRIKNACAAKCLSNWMDHVRKMRKAKRSVGMLLKKGMVCCFYEWQEYVKTKKETTQRLQHAAKKVLGKWMFSGLSRSFERWSEITVQSKRVKAIIYRMKNLNASRMFNEWHQFIKVRKEIDTKLESRGKKALCRILKFQTAKAFSHWVFATREIREMNRILRKVIFRIMHNTASRCFQDWSNFTKTQKGVRNLRKCRSDKFMAKSVDVACQWLHALRVTVLKKRSLRLCRRITQKRWNGYFAREHLNAWRHLLRSNSRKRQECTSKVTNFWKRRVFGEFARETERKKSLNYKWTIIQDNCAARVLSQAITLWTLSSEKSAEIGRGIEYLNSNRRRHLLARAFCNQRDNVRDKANLERKLWKAFHMKLLARIMVMWFNDAAKDSIVTKRSLSSGGDLFVDGRSSLGKKETSIEFGNELQLASSPFLHSRRRASVHAYSQFMSSQLRRASVELEGSFSGNIALSASASSGDQKMPGKSLHVHANESAANVRQVNAAFSPALRSSDL